MTYAELLNILYEMPKDRLEDTITIYEPYSDEYIAVIGSATAEEKTNDVLDDGHLYLILKA
jgi:hypothetical protein